MTRRGIQPGDRVTLHYRLSSMGNEIVDTFADDEPDTFLIGSGELDPRLEQHLLGLTVGTQRSFSLTPWDAFGERDEALVQTLPRRDFPEEAPVGHQAGFELPNGQNLLGTLVEVNENDVKVDFNHPLAGLPVELEVRILAIDNRPGHEHDQ